MIDLNYLLLATGTVVPILTGLVTSRVAHPGLKAAVLALLSALGGIGNELVSVGGNVVLYDWSASVANAVTVFLVGVGLHYGLLKPTGITGSEGVVQNGALAGGVGGPSTAYDR